MLSSRAKVVVLALALSSCRKTDEVSDRASNAAKPQPKLVESATSVNHAALEVSSAEKLAAKVGLADGLPDLKPVLTKPFPEGATEEQVCEAINNTQEKDLWVRFGHLVPMYTYGAILVLEATPQKIPEVEQLVEVDYKMPRPIEVFACPQAGSVLMYSRNMRDDVVINGHRFGRQHLSEEFEQKLGVKTRESFGMDDSDRARKRLSDYCRADAELCEALVKLDPLNQGVGMCNFAVLRAGADANDEAHLSKCLALPPKLKSCAYIEWTTSEEGQHEKCRCTLRAAYGLPLNSSCD